MPYEAKPLCYTTTGCDYIFCQTKSLTATNRVYTSCRPNANIIQSDDFERQKTNTLVGTILPVLVTSETYDKKLMCRIRLELGCSDNSYWRLLTLSAGKLQFKKRNCCRGTSEPYNVELSKRTWSKLDFSKNGACVNSISSRNEITFSCVVSCWWASEP